MAHYNDAMSVEMHEQSLNPEKVRWIDDYHYIDSCRSTHRYNKVQRMRLFYVREILALAANGLKDKHIQHAIQENPNRAVRAQISLTTIRDIIRQEVYDIDEWTAMGYSEEKKAQCDCIKQHRCAGRPKHTLYDDEIARLVADGYNGNQITAIFKEHGYRIARGTVYAKVKACAQSRQANTRKGGDECQRKQHSFAEQC